MMTNYIFKEQIIQIYAQEFINEHNYIVNKKSNAHIKKNNNVQNYSRTTGKSQDSVEDNKNTHEKSLACYGEGVCSYSSGASAFFFFGAIIL